jgi:hypothetical protein
MSMISYAEKWNIGHVFNELTLHFFTSFISYLTPLKRKLLCSLYLVSSEKMCVYEALEGHDHHINSNQKFVRAGVQVRSRAPIFSNDFFDSN